MNRFFKVTTHIIILSFLYSNCVYGLPVESFRSHTLSNSTPFVQPQFNGGIHNLAFIYSLLESEVLDLGQVDELRVLFRKLLEEDYEGITVVYNKDWKELFLYSCAKNKIFQIHRDRYTDLGDSTEQYPEIEGVIIKVYPYSDDRRGHIDALRNKQVISALEIRSLQPEDVVRISRQRLESLRDADHPLISAYRKILERSSEVTSAQYAIVSERLVKRDGEMAAGWLWTRGIPGLETYDADERSCLEKEARNAERIRDYILGNGRLLGDTQIPVSRLMLVDIKVWDGASGEDRNSNLIILRNINRLLENLGEEERGELIEGLGKSRLSNGIVIAILDQSRHWGENCRGDGFVGINRFLLEKIGETLIAIADEKQGENRKEVVAELEKKLDILELYLRTYIYHELRHEAFIKERKLLSEMIYESRGYADAALIDTMRPRDLLDAIGSLSPDEREEFGQGLERRQNGFDARYFVSVCKVDYGEFLNCLIEMGILDIDSMFLEAVAITGFALEVPVREDEEEIEEGEGEGVEEEARETEVVKGRSFGSPLSPPHKEGRASTVSEATPVCAEVASPGMPGALAAVTRAVRHKHYNELVIKDFRSANRNKIARKVFTKYEAMYEREDNELEYRGKISYLLYRIGLNSHIRIDVWRKHRADFRSHDRELAKKCIVRLIDFVAKSRPWSHKKAAQDLTVSLLTNGEFSRSIMRTELAFKTSGIVNTVAGDKMAYWQLVEEACQERVDKGDIRFRDITAQEMLSASVERELLPRLRILYLFQRYLYYLPAGDFNKTYRDNLRDLCEKYLKYKRGIVVTFDGEDITRFDRLYKKVLSILNTTFGIEGDEWENYFADEEEHERGQRRKDKQKDIIEILWNTFDFAINLAPGLGYKFTEPLLIPDGQVGTGDNETRFTREEIQEIQRLRETFYKDMESIDPREVKRSENSRRVQEILKIYRKKILKHRTGLGDILKRYGTDRDIRGNRIYRVWDLMRSTRSWASSVWVAREYSRLFRDGTVGKSLELDSGMSVFYRALRSQEVGEDRLNGLADVIADPAAEYFGDNPNRVSGDIARGNLMDMRTGNNLQLEKESQQLVVSLYQLHTIKNRQRVFDIFKEANRVLQYGGHFAITLPATREFSEEGLEALKEKMGFVPILTPGITWNEMSEDGRKRFVAVYGHDAFVRESNRLRNMKFYVVIFKKVEPIKEGSEELQDKSLLLPRTIGERGRGEAIELREQDVEDEEPGGIDVNDRELSSAAVLDGMSFHTGQVADKLTEGIGESDRLRARAENEELFVAAKELIERLWNKEISPQHRLRNFAKGDLPSRVEGALSYNGDYSDTDLAAMDALRGELEALDDFVCDNIQEFTIKLQEIRNRAGLANELNVPDKAKFDRVKVYVETDLSTETLAEVRDIHGKLLQIESDVAIRDRGEDARQRFVGEHWDEFEAMKILIRKYQTVGEKRDKRDIQSILATGRDNLTQSLFDLAKRINNKLAGRLSTDWRRFETLKAFEDEMTELFRWMSVEFIFTSMDMEFLSNTKAEWGNPTVSERSVFAKSDRSDIGRLAGCIKIVEEWKSLKDMIDWDVGLARLLRGSNENEYMGILDRELIYSSFMTGNRKLLPIGIEGLLPDRLRQAIITERDTMGDGQELIIAIDDYMGYSPGFFEALEGLGFEVKALSETNLTLEKDASSGAQRFIRRGKRIIVVQRKAEVKDVNQGQLKLIRTREDMQDYNTWFDTRVTVMQGIEPEDLNLNIQEFLSTVQIRRLYPDWAGRFLGRDRWTDEFFDKGEVEAAVRTFKEEEGRRAEAERKKREREVNLIKKTEMPIVSIQYGGVWTESLVRDLAHILIKLIDDFDNPPEPATLLNSNLIRDHPQLSQIPDNELTAKIEELIRYRQYDLQIERMFREFVKVVNLLVPDIVGIPNCYVEINGRKRVLDLLTRKQFPEGHSVLYWHVYGLGIDDSPFGKDSEDYYNEILGNILDLRHSESAEFAQTCPPLLRSTKQGLCAAYLSNPRELAERFKNIDGVSFITQICELPITKLMSEIFKSKNFETGYLRDVEHYMRAFQDYSRRDTSNARETMDFILGGFVKLFNEGMTRQEYQGFKEELDRKMGLGGHVILEIERRLVSVPDNADQDRVSKRELSPADMAEVGDGGDSYYYYMHGEGQERKVSTHAQDKIQPKFFTGDTEAKNFWEALYLLKNVRLYTLSNEEKEVIDRLTDLMLSTEDRDRVFEYRKEVVDYLKVRNTVNRFLYFYYMYQSKMLRVKDLKQANTDLEHIQRELSAIDPRLEIHYGDVSNRNLVVLLTEFYRLKKMLEDKSLKEAAMEIQLDANKLNKRLREKIPIGSQLEYELAIVGNLHHKDLIRNVLTGLEYLQRNDQYTIEFLIMTLSPENEHFLISNIEELKIFFIYYPDKKNVALRNIARAIIALRRHAGALERKGFVDIKRKIGEFLDRFREYCPGEIDALEVLIRGEAGNRQRFIDVLELVTLAKNRDRFSEERQDYCRLIREDQTFRTQRLAHSGVDTDEIEFIVRNIQNPYEIYYMWKSFTSRSSTSTPGVTINHHVTSSLVKKMEGFLRTSKDHVTDILTDSYNQFFTMRDFVRHALDESQEFRKYMVELLVSGDPLVSAYAYEYLDYYISAGERVFVSREKAPNIQEIFINILDGILAKGDRLNILRLRRAFKLFANAVRDNTGTRLDNLWRIAIDRHNQNRINSETLLVIGRNARWAMEELCEGRTDRDSIMARFGLIDGDGRDIFEKAIADKESGGRISFLHLDLALSVISGMVAAFIIYKIFFPVGIITLLGGIPLTAIYLILSLISPWLVHEVIGHFLIGKIVGVILERYYGYPNVRLRFHWLWTEVESVQSFESLSTAQKQKVEELRRTVAWLGPSLNFLLFWTGLVLIITVSHPLFILMAVYIIVSNLIAIITSMTPIGTFRIPIISRLRRAAGRQSDGSIIFREKKFTTELLKEEIIEMLRYNLEMDNLPALSREALNKRTGRSQSFNEAFNALIDEKKIMRPYSSDVWILTDDIDILTEKKNILLLNTDIVGRQVTGVTTYFLSSDLEKLIEEETEEKRIVEVITYRPKKKVRGHDVLGFVERVYFTNKKYREKERDIVVINIGGKELRFYSGLITALEVEREAFERVLDWCIRNNVIEDFFRIINAIIIFNNLPKALKEKAGNEREARKALFLSIVPREDRPRGPAGNELADRLNILKDLVFDLKDDSNFSLYFQFINQLMESEPDVSALLFCIRFANMLNLEILGEESTQSLAENLLKEVTRIFKPLFAKNFHIDLSTIWVDRMFQVVFPESYKREKKKRDAYLKRLKDELFGKFEYKGKYMEQFANVLKARIMDGLLRRLDPRLLGKIELRISAREKGVLSAYEKMERKGYKRLEDVYDLLALRIVVCDNPGVEEKLTEEQKIDICYHIWEVIKGLKLIDYVKEDSDDYIREKEKPTGYKALNTVWSCGEMKFEIQIKTEDMHTQAEEGQAAHYRYEVKRAIGDVLSPERSMVVIFREIEGEKQSDRLVRLPRGANVLDLLSCQDVNRVSMYGDGFTIKKPDNPTRTIGFAEKLYPGNVIVCKPNQKRKNPINPEHAESSKVARSRLFTKTLAPRVNWREGLKKILGEIKPVAPGIDMMIDRKAILDIDLLVKLAEEYSELDFMGLFKAAVDLKKGFVTERDRILFMKRLAKDSTIGKDLKPLLPAVEEFLTAVFLEVPMPALNVESRGEEGGAGHQEFESLMLKEELGSVVSSQITHNVSGERVLVGSEEIRDYLFSNVKPIKDWHKDVKGRSFGSPLAPPHKEGRASTVSEATPVCVSEATPVCVSEATPVCAEIVSTGMPQQKVGTAKSLPVALAAVELYLDNKLEELGVDILAILSEVLGEIPEKYHSNIGFNKKLAIGLVDASPTLFVDCRRNGFIGINKIFMDVLGKDKSTEKIVSKILLIIGIHHELFHEGGIEDEDWLLKEGLRLLRKLADKSVYDELIDRLKDIVKGDSVFLMAILMERLVSDAERKDILRAKLERILERIREGKRVELTTVQFNRLLWLIDRSKGVNLVPEIAELVDTILEPNYTGDPGEVIMAIEKEILTWLYTEEQFRKQRDIKTEMAERMGKERGKLLVKTFTGEFRFMSGEDIPPKVKDTLRYVQDYPVPEPSRTQQPHFVLIDEYRKQRFEKVIDRISDTWGVTFVTDIREIPKGIEPVVLIDPEDVDEARFKGFKWYLPLVYTEKSFILAAWLSINKPEKLKGTAVYEFVKGFYESLGVALTEDEVVELFSYPWKLKDKIVSFTDQLKILRVAFEELGTSV